MTINNSEIASTCAAGRVIFLVGTTTQDGSSSGVGYQRVKLATSMALTAQSNDHSLGVVVDLPVTGSVCDVSPTASQGLAVSR